MWVLSCFSVPKFYCIFTIYTVFFFFLFLKFANPQRNLLYSFIVNRILKNPKKQKEKDPLNPFAIQTHTQWHTHNIRLCVRVCVCGDHHLITKTFFMWFIIINFSRKQALVLMFWTTLWLLTLGWWIFCVSTALHWRRASWWAQVFFYFMAAKEIGRERERQTWRERERERCSRSELRFSPFGWSPKKLILVRFFFSHPKKKKQLPNNKKKKKGTCTGTMPVQPGSLAVSDYGPLGKITVQFTGGKWSKNDNSWHEKKIVLGDYNTKIWSLKKKIKKK